MRECGLKSKGDMTEIYCKQVTPCAGVWIEIVLRLTEKSLTDVTPCAGVWIEIPAT